MCIYDDTRYICGATIRHLVVPCSDQGTCLEHIRWTEHRAEECNNCRNTGQATTGPVFGIERLLATSTSSCAESGYLRGFTRDEVSRSQLTPEHTEHGTGNPCASQDHGERQPPDRRQHGSSISTTSASARENDEALSLAEHSAQPATEPENEWTEDDEVGGVKLDDEDRRILAEADRASGSDDAADRDEQQAGDLDDANVRLTSWVYG